jgi:hypothetical protein
MRLFLTLLALTALIGACTTSTSTSSDPEPLRFHEVVYGGCANVFDMPESSVARLDGGDPYPDPDTLIVEWDDSLEIFLGLNYICCAPFAADHEIIQDTLVLAVRDTCPAPNATCYCWCYCYYTFTWKFDGGEGDIRNLRVELYDPQVGTVAVLYHQQIDYN